MARKAVTDGVKRDDIIRSAQELFFEQGYDGTSVRTIMTKAKAEVGLFYYYFKNKDEVFDKVLDRFFSKYADNMHRTVRWAIREHTLTIIEPYLEQIVEIQSSYYCVPTAIAPKVAALYLTHGVGSAILHSDAQTNIKNRKEIKHGISLLMGMPSDEQELRIQNHSRCDMEK